MGGSPNSVATPRGPALRATSATGSAGVGVPGKTPDSRRPLAVTLIGLAVLVLIVLVWAFGGSGG